MAPRAWRLLSTSVFSIETSGVASTSLLQLKRSPALPSESQSCRVSLVFGRPRPSQQPQQHCIAPKAVCRDRPPGGTRISSLRYRSFRHLTAGQSPHPLPPGPRLLCTYLFVLDRRASPLPTLLHDPASPAPSFCSRHTTILGFAFSSLVLALPSRTAHARSTPALPPRSRNLPGVPPVAGF